MAKKTFKNDDVFKGGFESLIEPTHTPNEDISLSKTTKDQKEKKFTKITVRLDSELIHTIKKIAHWERITSTEFIKNSLESSINDYKKANKDNNI
jgi:predicted DNA binding CopG/RHH family protein